MLGTGLSRSGSPIWTLPDTAFPHVSLIRQMDAETVLAQALADRGVEVEYGTELVSARDAPDAARAVLRTGAAPHEAAFAFIAGCDGPASTVRTLSGIGWPGAPYPAEILLADVELAGDLACDRGARGGGAGRAAFAFRLGEQATWRLLFTRPASPGRPGCRSGSQARRSRPASCGHCCAARA